MSAASSIKFALTRVLLAVVMAVPIAGQALARTPATDTAGAQATIRLSELPRQGRDTYELIRKGGPFPYEKDGSVFGNRERLLPAHPRGYWREYTVKTPGSRDRGARRIVCGGPPRTPQACYYTSDHYASFRQIVE